MGTVFLVLGGALAVGGFVGGMVIFWRNGLRRIGTRMGSEDVTRLARMVSDPTKRGELLLLVVCFAATARGGYLVSLGVP